MVICYFLTPNVYYKYETRHLNLLFLIITYDIHSYAFGLANLYELFMRKITPFFSEQAFKIKYVSHMIFFRSGRNREKGQFSINKQVFNLTVC